jgi:hypothetical protein
MALGHSHLLFSRILTIERNLTPGDSQFPDDAVSAETDLLWVSTEIEQLIQAAPQKAALPNLDEALKQIAEAIELL